MQVVLNFLRCGKLIFDSGIVSVLIYYCGC